MDKPIAIRIDAFLETNLTSMSPTILLVEDEESDIFFLKKAFAKAGLNNPVQVATDGQQAIDYLKGFGQFADRQAFPLPYLVLLDLKLPLIMGLDILKWLREQPQFTSTVVVVLTSSVDERDVETAYALGANAYLVKPADATKLGAIAQSIKDFWFTQNRPAPTRAGNF
jgi:CheY-like chemotaxis protein